MLLEEIIHENITALWTPSPPKIQYQLETVRSEVVLSTEGEQWRQSWLRDWTGYRFVWTRGNRLYCLIIMSILKVWPSAIPFPPPESDPIDYTRVFRHIKPTGLLLRFLLRLILDYGIGRSGLWALLSVEPSAETLLTLQAHDFPASDIEG